ncbi:hypothetical protein L873DRAFT_1848862 [Choiromyces venosus 120613-1]|uniref:Uncharacterized protein n=1 Tax=Choiromyces venosus 120613-1 TaxID=1336337 RepID=A0A3N4IWV5_9PEZI|nr:hypothetical protein L873DRAFT_1848862 [Choiromyces venosus 120613-1]
MSEKRAFRLLSDLCRVHKTGKKEPIIRGKVNSKNVLGAAAEATAVIEDEAEIEVPQLKSAAKGRAAKGGNTAAAKAKAAENLPTEEEEEEVVEQKPEEAEETLASPNPTGK